MSSFQCYFTHLHVFYHSAPYERISRQILVFTQVSQVKNAQKISHENGRKEYTQHITFQQ